MAAVRGGRERLVNALFEAIEYEPTEEAMEEAKLLLLSQLHVTAESDPAFWLKALRAIVLEIKKPRGGGGGELGGGGGGGGGGGRGERRNSREEEGEEEDEEGGGEGASGLPSATDGRLGGGSPGAEGARDGARGGGQVGERVVALADAAGGRVCGCSRCCRTQTTLTSARRESGAKPERYLIEMLQELVSVAFTAGTSPRRCARWVW